MKRRFFNLACILLLLVAQQTAIAHAIWHAHEYGRQGPGSACEVACPDGSPAGHDPAQLCAFDIAFGQVLGGASGSPSALAVADCPGDAPTLLLDSAPRARFLAPLSRGPPTLL
jgi:hypothetical protein